MYGDYADTQMVWTTHLQPPEVKTGQTFAEKIAEQGPQVEVVNWIWEKVTGESLIATVIAPITGNWAQIEGNATAWMQTGDAVEQVAINLSDNVAKLDPHWNGTAAQAFEQHIDVVWGTALYAEAAVAKAISYGFTYLAGLSERMCQEALDLLTKLINKLGEAAAWALVPFAGWAKAADMVRDAYNMYQRIMSLYDAIQQAIDATTTLFNELQSIQNALAAIPEVGSASDAMELGQQLGGSVGKVKEAATSVKDSASQAKTSVQGGAPP